MVLACKPFLWAKIFSMRTLLLVMVTAIVSAGCQKQQEKLAINESLFDAGVSKAVLKTKVMSEASGLTESINHPNFLWTHNDSGDKARIFLIDTLANLKATVWLSHDEQRDWEDIASGPGPVDGKNYIYVGDIGDNNAKHKYKFIYRIEEPDLAHSVDTTINEIDTIKFELPDGRRDSESMMLDPLTRDIYILSKREEKVNLYRLPYPQSTTETMKAELALAKLEFNQYQGKAVSKNGGETLINGYHPTYYNQVVSADISRDGREILIKTYSSIYYWKRENNESIVEVLKRKPTILPYKPEPQGEAITFDLNGKGYFTLNEEFGKMPQQLFFYKRK